MSETGQDAARSNILYLLSGFLMERRNVVCAVEDRLDGEEGGTIVGCVGVVSAQTVPEVYVGFSKTERVITDPTKITLSRSFIYLTQIPRDRENLRAPAMPATKRFSQSSHLLRRPICLPRLQPSHCLTFPHGSPPQHSHSHAHHRYSWPSTKLVQIVSSGV